MNRRLALLLPLLLAAPALAAGDPHAAPASVFAGTIIQSASAVIVFLLLLFLLRKYAWGPILAGLQDRENRIKKDLEHAEQAARQASQTLREYQAQLAKAREDVSRMLNQARIDAENTAHRIEDETQQQIAQARRRAEAEIQYAKEQAVQQIFTQTAGLAADIAGKILSREVKAEDHRQLVEQSLSSVRAQDLN